MGLMLQKLSFSSYNVCRIWHTTWIQECSVPFTTVVSLILSDYVGHILSILILMTWSDFIKTVFLCYYLYIEIASCLTSSVTDIKGNPNYCYKNISWTTSQSLIHNSLILVRPVNARPISYLKAYRIMYIWIVKRNLWLCINMQNKI